MSEKGFSLVELMLVIILIAALAVIITMIVNPVSNLKKSRDATRMTDLNNLQTAINAVVGDGLTQGETKSTLLCKDSTPPCYGTSIDATSSNRNSDGTGWVKVDLSTGHIVSLPALPVDPSNPLAGGTTDYHYIYKSDGNDWEIATKLESDSNSSKLLPNGYYAVGSNRNLIAPVDYTALVVKPSPGPSGSAKPSTLYVMDGNALVGATVPEQAAFEALQGIVNKGNPQIYILSNFGDAHDSDWITLLNSQYGVPVTVQTDYSWYFKTFKPLVKGYIKYNYQTSQDQVNIATSLAGLLDAVPVDSNDSALMGLMQADNYTQLLDVSSWTYDSLRSSSYWPKLNKSGIFEISPTTVTPTSRDEAVMTNSAVFWDPTATTDPSFTITSNMVADQTPGSYIHGWGQPRSDTGEGTFLAFASTKNVGFYAEDVSGNLSVYKHFPVSGPLKNSAPPALPTATNVHYVTVYMSDGDNPSVWLNRFTKNGLNEYASSSRGTAPIGWTMAPNMINSIPAVTKAIYDAKTPNDYFIAATTGWGTVFPSYFPNLNLSSGLNNSLFPNEDLHIIADMDIMPPNNTLNDAFSNTVLDPLTASPDVTGVFFTDFLGNDKSDGTMFWSNSKPVVFSSNDVHLGTASGHTGTQDVPTVASHINGLPTDATKPSGYTLIYANSWSTTVQDIINLKNDLGPNVMLVRPDVFVSLMTKNIPH